MATVFLSHSSKDKFFVRRLAEEFTSHGVDVWIDDKDIKVGDMILDKIAEGITSSDFLIAVLSGNSVESEWVKRELSMGMQKEIGGRTVRVLPVVIDNCAIPSFLQGKRYADFRNPQTFRQSFDLLLEAIGVEPLSTPKSETATIKSDTVIANKANLIKNPEDVLLYFEDVRIIGVLMDQVVKVKADSMLFDVPFRLSARPSAEWVQIFEAERSFPRHSMWRKAWVEDDRIVVRCPVHEVKQYHLDDIKSDVRSSNSKYRDHLVRQEQQRRLQARRQHDEQQQVNEALIDLNFND